MSKFKINLNQYKSMVTHLPTFKRVSVACLTMVFQQWTGAYVSNTFFFDLLICNQFLFTNKAL